MAWVDILTHQEALRTPAVKISGPEKKDFEVRTCVRVCVYAFVCLFVCVVINVVMMINYYYFLLILFI